MSQKRIWTKDEDLVILRAVKQNPQQKLSVTLMAVARELDRSVNAVYTRYSNIREDRKSRIWNKEAERKLVKAVKANPYNRQEAFRQVAQELGITPAAASAHWYHNNFEICTMAFSPKQKFLNRTSYVEGRNRVVPTTPRQRFWNRIKALFGL